MKDNTRATSITRLGKIRYYGSRYLYIIALILLVLSAYMFVKMWLQANVQGAVPDTTWGEKFGNHGPWRHQYNLRSVFYYITNALFCSTGFAIISFIIKPNLKSVIVAFVGFAAFCLFMYTHYWLVD